jgi:hypothetical protein
MSAADVKQIFQTMGERFNTNAARGLNAIVQFDI